MGLNRRLIELTRGTRRWIAATVALGWLIVALNVAQTVLVGRAISFGFPFDYGFVKK